MGDIVDSEDPVTNTLSSSKTTDLYIEDTISFSEVDIITPAQKLLARQLTCDIVPRKSLLVTGKRCDFFIYLLMQNLQLTSLQFSRSQWEWEKLYLQGSWRSLAYCKWYT